MAKQREVDPSQLPLFDDPLLWWPGLPPRRRRGEDEGPLRRPRAAPDGSDQLALFDLPERARPGRVRRARARKPAHRQTYLDVADALGLPRLQALVNLPATYFMMDALPLRVGLRADTLLDARYRIEASLVDAFDDLAEISPHRGSLALWAGRRTGLTTARSPQGEALVVALARSHPHLDDPFILRLRGLPGYLGHEDGPTPFEEGEELLSVWDGETVYPLLPAEAQPLPLHRLLAG